MRRAGGKAIVIAAAGMLLAAAPCFAAQLKVDQATQRRLGVTVAPAQIGRMTPSVRGFAKVLDAGPLAALEADIEQAAAAAQASAAELKRAQALNAADQAVSVRAVEVARAQARADESKLALLRRRLGLEWGPGIAGLSGARRSALLGQIAAGRAALVRIDTPSGRGLAGLRTASIELVHGGVIRAVVLGPARVADVQLQSPGLIALAAGPGAGALSVGLTSPVQLATGAAASGVLVPRSALLRAEGRTWVYVRKGPESFERRAVVGEPDAQGVFTSQGVSPGEPVVIAGAAALFAAEHPAAAEE
jgi:hypothetical protein